MANTQHKKNIKSTISQSLNNAPEGQKTQEEQQTQGENSFSFNGKRYNLDFISGALIINGAYNPKLDPEAAEFNFTAYNKEMKEFGESFKEYAQKINDRITPEFKAATNEAVQSILHSTKEILSPQAEEIKASIQKMKAEDKDLKARFEEWERIKPTLLEEWSKPENEGIDFRDFISNNEKVEKIISDIKRADKDKENPSPDIYQMLISKPFYEYIETQALLTAQDEADTPYLMDIEDVDNVTPLTIRTEGKTKTGRHYPKVVDRVSISYTGELKGLESLMTLEDLAYYNAAISFWVYWTKPVFGSPSKIIIPLEALIRFETQRDKVTNDKLLEVKKHYKKLLSTLYKIDISEEVKAGIIPAVDPETGDSLQGLIIEKNLLSGGIIETVEKNGDKKFYLEIDGEPLGYMYSRLKKQCIELSSELLELPKGIKATDTNIKFREYLIREINQMKNGHRDSTLIKLDSVLKKTQEETANATERKRKIDTITKILQGFVDKGFITKYELKRERKGRKKGFEISFR